MFHATEEIRSYNDWYCFLWDGDIEIYDEYGKKIKKEDFFELVKNKQKPIYDNHAELYPEGSFLDSEGYSMTENEFS